MIALGTREQLPISLLAAWSNLVLHRLVGNTIAPDRVEIGLGRAMAFMKRRFADTIRVTDIAKAAGMSTTKLYAAFQQGRLTTPHAQLTAFRLDAAERLLADPRLSTRRSRYEPVMPTKVLSRGRCGENGAAHRRMFDAVFSAMRKEMPKLREDSSRSPSKIAFQPECYDRLISFGGQDPAMSVVSVGANVLLLYMLSRQQASKIGVIFYFVPIITMFGEHVFYGTTQSAETVIGAVIVVLSSLAFAKLEFLKQYLGNRPSASP